MRIGILLVLALVGAAPVPAQTPAVGSWHEQVRRLRRAHAATAPIVKRTCVGADRLPQTFGATEWTCARCPTGGRVRSSNP